MTINPNTGIFQDVATLVITDLTLTADRWNMLQPIPVGSDGKKFVMMIYKNPIVLTGDNIYQFPAEGPGQYMGADYQPINEYSGYVYKFFVYPMISLGDVAGRNIVSENRLNEILEPVGMTVDQLHAWPLPDISVFVPYFQGYQGMIRNDIGNPEWVTNVVLVTGIKPRVIDPDSTILVDNDTMGLNETTQAMFNNLYSMGGFGLVQDAEWAVRDYFADDRNVKNRAWVTETWDGNNLTIGLRMYALVDKTKNNMCPRPFECWYVQGNPASNLQNSNLHLVVVGVEQKPEPEPEPPTT